MRNGQELKKKNRHQEFLIELMNYQRDFVEFHKQKYAILKKQANSIRGHLDWKDRQESVRREKNEKERIKALREHDMDAYIELINTTKNKRLIEILQ